MLAEDHVLVSTPEHPVRHYHVGRNEAVDGGEEIPLALFKLTRDNLKDVVYLKVGDRVIVSRYVILQYFDFCTRCSGPKDPCVLCGRPHKCSSPIAPTPS